jgi:hypothetical protein
MIDIRIPGTSPENPICDFCSDAPFAALLTESRFFHVETIPNPMHSEGEWYCCAPCFSFIARRDRDGLAGRALQKRLHQFGLLSSDSIARTVKREILTIQAVALDQLDRWNWPVNCVHILNETFPRFTSTIPACVFSLMPVRDWPPGHVWTRFQDWRQSPYVICEICETLAHEAERQ